MGTTPRPRLSWAKVLVAVALALGTIITSSPGAQAASCYNMSCNQKDPNAQGCDASGTPRSMNYNSPEAQMQLRYSSECDVYWARFVYSGAWNCCVRLELRAEQEKWNGTRWQVWRHKRTTFTYGDTQANIWTTMSPNETNDRHRVCVQNVCTAWNS